MIRTNVWIPDTCRCEIEYTWDDSVPAEQRIHIPKSVKKCMAHDGVDEPTAYGKVKEENDNKNIAVGMMMEQFPEIRNSIEDISFRFSEDRNKIFVSHKSLKGADKSALNLLPKIGLTKEIEFE